MHAVRDFNPTAIEIDEELIALAKKEGALEREIGRTLLRALSARVHELLGMASFVEYTSRRLGYTPRITKEKLRVARALDRLPRLARAVESGTHSWSAARELTRVATAKTESEWVERSAGKTLREVERMVSGLRPGARPTDAPDPQLVRHRLFADMSAEQYALTMEVFTVWRGRLGPTATNADILAAIAEDQLSRDRAPGVSAFQMVLGHCTDCGRTQQRAGSEMIEVPDHVGACARCDGEVVGLAALDDHDCKSDDEMEPTPVGPTLVPESLSPETDSPSAQPESKTHGGQRTADLKKVAVLALRALSQAGGIRVLLRIFSEAMGVGPRSVTPKLREMVLARDHHRCAAPGCTHAGFLQIHHLDPQANGGRHTLDNLISLCSKHHSLHHDGLYAIELSADGDLIFRSGATEAVIKGWAATKGRPPGSIDPGESHRPVR